MTKWLRWRLALRGRLALTKGLLALLGRLTEGLLLPLLVGWRPLLPLWRAECLHRRHTSRCGRRRPQHAW